jgi:hypothetical protein
MGSKIGPRAIRITVEDAATNQTIVAILTDTLGELRQEAQTSGD